MKNILPILVAVFVGAYQTAWAQIDAGTVSKFLAVAKGGSDSQLGVIGSELADKVQSLGKSAAGEAVRGKLDETLKSLTGGKDSAALLSAFDLVKAAKLTPDQIGLAKQVGNLASAYVVQRNFASLDGSQGEVAGIVKSLRTGKLKDVVTPMKNVMSNAKLTDMQKQLIGNIADKYAPGLSKAAGAANALKKLPGFSN
jgi:hypothetical protein